jgi:ABC-type multidrug transport system ATPase subunit
MLRPKTTFSLLATSGTGSVGGVSPHDRQELKRVIRLMPESQGYYGYMTPPEYLRCFGGYIRSRRIS